MSVREQHKTQPSTPKIIHIHCPDVPDLTSYSPSGGGFLLPLELTISFNDGLTSSIFFIMVADREGKRRYRTQHSGAGMRKLRWLVVARYNWQDILARLQSMVAACEDACVEASIKCLQAHFAWEYE